MKLDPSKIKKYRSEKAFTQEALAGKAKLSVRTIQRAEKGESLSYQNVLEIASALEVDHNSLKSKNSNVQQFQDYLSNPKSNLTSMPLGKPHYFFARRFALTFPGQRGIRTFEEPKDLEKRLKLFFEEPFLFSDDQPIWYWHDGDMHIERFKKIGPRIYLMNLYELKLRKISTVYSSDPRRMFIYVETEAMPETGVNKIPGEIIEAYGVYKDKNVSYEEYMDGSTETNGEIINFDGTEELRWRPLRDFNFLIAPRTSVINNRNFEDELPVILEAMLNGEANINDMKKKIDSLPKRL